MKSRNYSINNNNNLNNNNNISINSIDKLESQVNIIDNTSDMPPKKSEDVSKDNGIINVRNLRLLFCFIGLQVIDIIIIIITILLLLSLISSLLLLLSL